jgi:hypothetical protein
MEKQKLVGMIAAVAVIVGAGSFYGGVTYAKSKGGARGGGNFVRMAEGTAVPSGQGQGARGGNARFAAGMNGGFAGGEIIAKDDTSITVKLMDGGSKIVFLSGDTKITKSSDGTKDDLKVGEQVTVMGQPGSDGSLTAANVQLGVAGMFRMGAPRQGEAPRP